MIKFASVNLARTATRMKHILIVDNYDSFTYNLVHYVEAEGFQVSVARNDVLDLTSLDRYDKIILSPGPGLPKDAGQLMTLIRQWHNKIPILGVCLGHQAMAEVFGAQLIQLKQVTHGIGTTMTVLDDQEPMFQNLPQALIVGRYHSWIVGPMGLSDDLKITAIDEQGNIMALRHTLHPITGIQFHPESLLTPHGKKMLRQWLVS